MLLKPVQSQSLLIHFKRVVQPELLLFWLGAVEPFGGGCLEWDGRLIVQGSSAC